MTGKPIGITILIIKKKKNIEYKYMILLKSFKINSVILKNL